MDVNRGSRLDNWWARADILMPGTRGEIVARNKNTEAGYAGVALD